MGVYTVLWQHPYYDPRVLGVYSTRELAEKVVVEHKKEWKLKEGRYYSAKGHRYEVVLHTVDE